MPLSQWEAMPMSLPDCCKPQIKKLNKPALSLTKLVTLKHEIAGQQTNSSNGLNNAVYESKIQALS